MLALQPLTAKSIKLKCLQWVYGIKFPSIELLLLTFLYFSKSTTFVMSETCNSMAFGHSSGSLHLFAKGDQNPQFNTYSVPTLFVDPVIFFEFY